MAKFIRVTLRSGKEAVINVGHIASILARGDGHSMIMLDTEVYNSEESFKRGDYPIRELIVRHDFEDILKMIGAATGGIAMGK